MAPADDQILLNQVTGLAVFDPIASILIGLLLVSVAFWMGRDARHLLVGTAALPEERQKIEQVIESYDEIDEVQELLTLVLGPNALLVAARVDLRNDLDGAQVEQVSSEIDRDMGMLGVNRLEDLGPHFLQRIGAEGFGAGAASPS